MQKVIVLTGAGMSADSGLATFRDSGGLWEGYDINDVATVEAWERDPETVLAFYNKRRKQAMQAEPNAGHKALARLEEKYDVTIITQNVDNLHEQAGSTDVLHLHGQLNKARSVDNPEQIIDIGDQPIEWGDKAEDGSQLRPHVVWFGEMVPMMEPAMQEMRAAEVLVVIGTSLVVYPAAGLVDLAPPDIPRYIVDPSRPQLYSDRGWEHYQERAAEGTPKLVDKLLDKAE